MPWKGSVLSQRLEFVTAALLPGANRRQLCRDFSISPDTAYRLIMRFKLGDPDALADRSRRPLSSPSKSAPEVEQRVLAIRDQHPAWGARKIQHVLARRHSDVPVPSTITAILRRYDRIDPAQSAKRKPFIRFQAEAPNHLWQMDFKGWFRFPNGRQCHPLTIIDDHSRFALGVFACASQHGHLVRAKLTAVFRQYGLPLSFLADNGSCWGGHRNAPHTELSVWLMRLGIAMKHGRPRHPQTQGKDERFNRTLKDEVLTPALPADFLQAQQSFDRWRHPVYNLQRPHEALAMAVPASRYQPSPRTFPEKLPALEYPAALIVRKIQDGGILHFNGRQFFIGGAFRGQPIALKQTADLSWDILFGNFTLGAIKPQNFALPKLELIRPLR